MSAVEDWLEFAGTLESGSASSGAGSDWTLLFARRTRTVALPAKAIPDSDSLRFFVLTARKRLWARLALIFHRLIPMVLPQSRLSDNQHRELQRLLDGVDVDSGTRPVDIMAIQFGSRGPLQKVTVLARSSNGEQLVGKFALRTSADERIAIEATCLERLARESTLAANVPSLIRSGTTASGRGFFVMGAVSGAPTGNTFGEGHADFLRGLSAVDPDVRHWNESELVREIEERFATLARDKKNDLQPLLAGWNSACRALADREVPLCLNHGDFASWNLLQSSEGLMALDWEYARPRWNPLGDYFHFHVIPAALDGSLLKPSFRRDLLLSNASDHAARVFGIDRAFAAAITTPLLLVYLIDTITFYAVVSGGVDRRHPVVNSYWQWITELQ